MNDEQVTSLVLVPGLACDAAVWDGLHPFLPSGWQSWVPVLAAHDSIHDMAAALLRNAPATRFALAGHSLGGRIALEVMRQAPHRVQRLALLDTGHQARSAGEAGERELEQRMALVALARERGMRAMAERWAPGMLHPARLGQAAHEAVLAMVERQTADGFARQQQALLHRPDTEAVLDAIRCPTLVLCGREDLWSPLERHREIAGRVAGASFVVVDDCGHMSTMEQPEAVGAAFAAWLE